MIEHLVNKDLKNLPNLKPSGWEILTFLVRIKAYGHGL